MTITYGGNFLKCVLRWKGSVWKAIWKELTVWLFCYIILHLILSYAMPGYKEKIHLIIKLFDEYTRKMPVEFLLGFYVGQIVKRWWEQVKVARIFSGLFFNLTSIFCTGKNSTMAG